MALLPSSAAAWLSSEVSSWLLVVYFPFHLGICLKDRRRKKKPSRCTLLITELFEAGAKEAPGTFTPGAQGLALPGGCFPVLEPPKPRLSPPRMQAQTGHWANSRAPDLGVGSWASESPHPSWTPGTAKDASGHGGLGDFLNPGRQGAGGPALPDLWPLWPASPSHIS